jgi:putative ATP-dependent endonuclease of OLD family
VYLSTVVIEGFRCFGEEKDRLELSLDRGLTALVGENDAGKSAVIDALRFALGTTDQEWIRLDDTDISTTCKSSEIDVKLKFEDLDLTDKRALVEYLTFEGPSRIPVFYLNWSAREPGSSSTAGSQRRVECHSGKDGEGPLVPTEVRDMFRATYLRPLRDASHALLAGRGSRLSQVLHRADEVRNVGSNYDPTGTIDPKALNVLGIGDLANDLLAQQTGIVSTRTRIDQHLQNLALNKEQISSSIRVSGATASPEVRLRALLEKLDLLVNGPEQQGKLGLGSNNLLFIACELLLLSAQKEGCRLLLIEEPEAHLHPQRQLRVMKFLQEESKQKHIQVIVTTHSPNLASAIDLDNLVIVRKARAH